MDDLDDLMDVIEDYVEHRRAQERQITLKAKAKRLAAESSEAHLRGDNTHEQVAMSWAENLWADAQRAMSDDAERFSRSELRDVLKSYLREATSEEADRSSDFTLEIS